MIRTVPASGPWFAFATCCLIWGSTFLFIGIGNDSLPPVWGATLRLVIASVLLAAIARGLRRRWPRGRELAAAVGFGVIDFGVSLPLLYWGQREVPSGVASVMYATIPLSTALFAWLFRLERLRTSTVLAALAAVAGVALLSRAPLGPAVSAGAMVAVALGAVTASLSGVVLKLAPDSDPFAMNSIAHACGAAVCIVISAVLGERWALPDAAGWVPILYLSTMGSIGAFVTFAWLIRHWPVSRTSFIAVVTPVIGLALGVIVRGESLSAVAVLGAGIVLAAVLLGLGLQRRA